MAEYTKYRAGQQCVNGMWTDWEKLVLLVKIKRVFE